MKLLRSQEERFVASRHVRLHFLGKNESLEGYVVKETEWSMWLQQAQILVNERSTVTLEGVQIVPRRNVWWVQVLEEASG